ncbi:MAG: cytochrome c [Rhodocyclales bacterium]|nr:cytochrome c [Rhodocyclales bacterium]
MKKAKFKAIAAAAVLGLGLCGAAWSQAPSPEEMQRAKEFMQKSKAMMKPELREKADALPPEIQQFLFKVAVKHTRRSETLTMRQVMQELLADYQAVAGAIATDNGELAADAARRLAHHRLPRGGMLPYLPLEKITGKDLGVLPAMEEAVEGGAMKLAAAAEKGDMAAAARHFGDVTAGCVACHAHFRGQPGVSARLK